jgi:hypothetical protein
MAYYQYYQSGGPWMNTWGTSQYQFQPPPLPSYQPAASWTPYDYFHHHADMNDSTFFDYVFSKIRNVLTGDGVSRGEAEHWHRRIYGGLVDIRQLLPREIGAAAAWETLRLWQSHNALYTSAITGGRERERESIISLAIAEGMSQIPIFDQMPYRSTAARLWNYVGRPLDKYGRREAAESAGATASRIFVQVRQSSSEEVDSFLPTPQLYDYDTPYDPYRGGGGRWGIDDEYSSSMRHHRGSFSGYPMDYAYAGSAAPIPIGSSYAGSAYGGGYAQPYGQQYLSAGGYPGSYGSPYAGGSQIYSPALSTSPGQVILRTDTSGSGRRHRHRSSSGGRHRKHRSRSYSTSGFIPPVAYSTGSGYM